MKVVAWGQSLEGMRKASKAASQLTDLDKDKDLFAKFLDTGRVSVKKLRCCCLFFAKALRLASC